MRDFRKPRPIWSGQGWVSQGVRLYVGGELKGGSVTLPREHGGGHRLHASAPHAIYGPKAKFSEASQIVTKHRVEKNAIAFDQHLPLLELRVFFILQLISIDLHF